MKYIFKATTEYELVVEADNEDAAYDIADGTFFDKWQVTERPEPVLVEKID